LTKPVLPELKISKMKKYFISALLGLMVLPVLSSCFHDHNISISISDDEDEYEMDASYKRNQTHAVQVYLDEHLVNNSIISFRNEDMDEEVTLDDKTAFYIKSNPGELRIKIDKNKNSEESCEKVRQICEDLKDILADN
jgi:hypothetical protein